MWARNLKINECVICNKNEAKHRSKGICNNCFESVRYKDPQYKKEHDAIMKKWRKNNPETLKKINERAVKKYMQKNRQSYLLYQNFRYLFSKE